MGLWVPGCLGHLGHLVVSNLSSQVSIEHPALVRWLKRNGICESVGTIGAWGGLGTGRGTEQLTVAEQKLH